MTFSRDFYTKTFSVLFDFVGSSWRDGLARYVPSMESLDRRSSHWFNPVCDGVCIPLPDPGEGLPQVPHGTVARLHRQVPGNRRIHRRSSLGRHLARRQQRYDGRVLGGGARCHSPQPIGCRDDTHQVDWTHYCWRGLRLWHPGSYWRGSLPGGIQETPGQTDLWNNRGVGLVILSLPHWTVALPPVWRRSHFRQ
ncbi:hypothetical protein EGW08_016324 [Elysia chlorotica]|uniref:Uncharacterized protein n=1 Tax=Elysia chlorotica TaxID=188477 RepID=A0A433T2Y0_ELYCH|nr:hypothetical protein EGW08_016324 [Elysia chlorotica]